MLIFETFSLVTIREILPFAITKGWDALQLAVQNAFLNGVLNEEVYMA